MTIRFGSVCSGIGSPELAWSRLGWRPQWCSDIEAAPSAIIAHRFNTPNLGDMTKIHEREEFHGRAIDLLVGGTPCQSFSVAGLRKGLADPRGNLTLVYLSLLDRARPRWMVWENVPGILSDDEGRTFGTFLGGLEKLGYRWAYRVLDAQYIRVESHARAVPQRRRRVFVVGYLGDWRPPAAVLFERESLQGHSPPRRKTGQEVAGTLSARTEGGGGLGTDFELSGGLIARTLTTREGRRWDPTAETIIPVPFDTTQITHPENRSNPKPGDPSPCLSKTAHPPAIAYRVGADGDAWHQGDAAAALTTLTDKTSQVLLETKVRRLTPLECERLQGFPDGYTNILFRGKPMADGPRYKALGNSMAVNVMSWIGERISLVDSLLVEHGRSA